MPEGGLKVTVTWSPSAREVVEHALQVAPGTTLRQALDACSAQLHLGPDPWRGLAFGVWGRKAPADHVLRDGDRVEAYRPLRVDPKVARRERFNKQGKRSAGLFARRRAGGDAGP